MIVLFVVTFSVSAQQERAIITAVPFLNIAADARAAGMGDMGVATSFDVFAQQWNPAKFAFASQKTGIGIGYTPYLEGVADDVALLNASFYNKINFRSAFAFSIRYFGLGDTEFVRDISDLNAQVVNPNEFAIDGSYALKLSETFAMAISGKLISSNLRFQDASQDTQAAYAFAVGVSGFFQSRKIPYARFDGRWRFGFNLSDHGPPLQYDEGGQDNFLPTNLRLGGGFDFILDQDNILGVYAEFNKLLVPTPRDFDGDGRIDAEDIDEYRQINFFSGVFESFGDAPGGLSEELQEITWALGVEYAYQEAFMLRSGYFHESLEKGARQFFTLGAGFVYKEVQIDLSYLFSTSPIRNPLENALRLALTFNFGKPR